MFFAKTKTTHPLIGQALFIFAYGFLLSFFLMVFMEKLGFSEQGLNLKAVGISFVLGMGLGYFLEKAWRKMKGLPKALLSSLVLFLTTCSFAMISLAIGATLGGNGDLSFDWAGLSGYESVGLVFGCFGGFIGTWLGTRAFFDSKKPAQLLLSNAVVLLALLFLGDVVESPNLSSLSVLVMPALSMLLHYKFKQ